MSHVYPRESASLSLSLSLGSVAPHALSVTTMCVYSVVSWGRLSLERCIGDGRGRVGETVEPYDGPREPRAARLETAVTHSCNVPETAAMHSSMALIAGPGSPPLPGFPMFL